MRKSLKSNGSSQKIVSYSSYLNSEDVTNIIDFDEDSLKKLNSAPIIEILDDPNSQNTGERRKSFRILTSLKDFADISTQTEVIEAEVIQELPVLIENMKNSENDNSENENLETIEERGEEAEAEFEMLNEHNELLLLEKEHNLSIDINKEISEKRKKSKKRSSDSGMNAAVGVQTYQEYKELVRSKTYICSPNDYDILEKQLILDTANLEAGETENDIKDPDQDVNERQTRLNFITFLIKKKMIILKNLNKEIKEKSILAQQLSLGQETHSVHNDSKNNQDIKQYFEQKDRTLSVIENSSDLESEKNSSMFKDQNLEQLESYKIELANKNAEYSRNSTLDAPKKKKYHRNHNKIPLYEEDKEEASEQEKSNLEIFESDISGFSNSQNDISDHEKPARSKKRVETMFVDTYEKENEDEGEHNIHETRSEMHLVIIDEDPHNAPEKILPMQNKHIHVRKRERSGTKFKVFHFQKKEAIIQKKLTHPAPMLLSKLLNKKLEWIKRKSTMTKRMVNKLVSGIYAACTSKITAGQNIEGLLEQTYDEITQRYSYKKASEKKFYEFLASLFNTTDNRRSVNFLRFIGAAKRINIKNYSKLSFNYYIQAYNSILTSNKGILVDYDDTVDKPMIPKIRALEFVSTKMENILDKPTFNKLLSTVEHMSIPDPKKINISGLVDTEATLELFVDAYEEHQQKINQGLYILVESTRYNEDNSVLPIKEFLILARIISAHKYNIIKEDLEK